MYIKHQVTQKKDQAPNSCNLRSQGARPSSTGRNTHADMHTGTPQTKQTNILKKKTPAQMAVRKPIVNTVRCPFCTFHNQLPTTICKKCKVDLRTGVQTKRRSIFTRCLISIFKNRFMSILFSLLQIGLLVYLYFFISNMNKEQNILTIGQGSPLQTKSSFIIEAEKALGNLRQLLLIRQMKVENAMPPHGNSNSRHDYTYQSNLTPAQRHQTTKELFDIIDGKQSANQKTN